MMKWLNTFRWKNLLIIWISIIVVILPYLTSQLEYFFDFFLWGIICTCVAAIGNITNDLLDVKQDRENKKKNIFKDGENKKSAWAFIFILLMIAGIACAASDFFSDFLVLSSLALVGLLLYNLVLKKAAIIGNCIIALITALIFVGIDTICISSVVYSNLGFKTSHIELLAGFAFITTLIREIIKDAEDRKGDKYAGFNTIAKFMNDKWLSVLILILTIVLSGLFFVALRLRHFNYAPTYFIYNAWVLMTVLGAYYYMLVNTPFRYIRATRIIKVGMLGCLLIYLILSV